MKIDQNQFLNLILNQNQYLNPTKNKDQGPKYQLQD
jgi:hypothetical protein